MYLHYLLNCKNAKVCLMLLFNDCYKKYYLQFKIKIYFNLIIETKNVTSLKALILLLLERKMY